MPLPFQPALERVEDRLTPAWAGPVTEAVVLVPTGEAGRVRVVGGRGTDLGDFVPFPDGFSGEVRVAVADVTGDYRRDLVVAAGPGGGARVRVFDGVTLAPVADFLAFEPSFRGGAYVAAGDVNRDGYADLIVGAGEGGAPRVRVFDGRDPSRVLADFLTFEPDFRGGVRVAAADVDEGGYGFQSEIVTGAGEGGAPRVSVFRGDGTPISSFYAYDPGLRTGVSVAAAPGNTLHGFEDKVLTAPGAGGGPLVRVLDAMTGREFGSFLAGDPDGRAGLQLTSDRGGWVIAARPTAGGPDLALYSTSGQYDWNLPAGRRLVRGLVTGVDPAAGTVTLRVPTEPGDLSVAFVPGGGLRLPDGTDRTFAVGPTVVVTRKDAAVRLGDVRSDDPYRDEVTLLTSADGLVLELRARPAGFRGPAIE